jgi:hypothetical protein
MTTAILVKVVRDPRSDEVHLPNEEVAIMSVIRNLNRTLLKMRWQAGGSCVVFTGTTHEPKQPTRWKQPAASLWMIQSQSIWVSRRPKASGCSRFNKQLSDRSADR